MTRGLPLWTEALARQFAALKLAQLICKDGHDGRLRVGDALTTQAPPGILAGSLDAALFLPRSEAFAWTGETTTAVQRAAESMPDDAIVSARDLPARVCWWWFEDPLPFQSRTATDDTLDRSSIAALTLARLDGGELQVLVYRRLRLTSDGTPIAVSFMLIPPGRRLGDLRGDIDVAASDDKYRLQQSYWLTRFVVAACVWLRQRVVVQSLGHVERHCRRQLEREHNLPMPSDVKVIQLRRAEAQPSSAVGGRVEWSCRWIVNGFWRNQPFKDGYRVIYINPFIKGPADRPLRVPTHTVYQVSR